jgi:hypothetical protein
VSFSFLLPRWFEFDLDGFDLSDLSRLELDACDKLEVFAAKAAFNMIAASEQVIVCVPNHYSLEC